MKINKENNVYTVIYAAVLVVLVGFILALVYQLLRPAQLENIANDTKKQILAAALIFPTGDETVSDLFEKHITDSYCINSKGDKLTGVNAMDVNMQTEIKKNADERELPVFVCDTEKGTKYVVPVAGAGLWGPIWGYIAMDSNGKDIYGAYFGHQGETPGLGAEIEKPAFSDQFKGKQVIKDGRFRPIAVVKAGQQPLDGEDYVDGISGGTITSKGVGSMLDNCLVPYRKFLQSLSDQQTPNTSESWQKR